MSILDNLNIMPEVKTVQHELVALRRELHRHPEIGFEEFETSKYIAEKLTELGLEVKTQIAKTGVLGILNKGKPGRTVAIRSDMDALPIEEANDVPYKSLNKGKMHACGHDAHMAILLTLAKILSEQKDEIPGCVKFIFQPAEETTGGAKIMIDEGVLEAPKVDALFALHVWASLEVGQVGVNPGSIMAAPDELKVTIVGKGGHGAMPHLSIDPIMIAAQVISALQAVVSRYVDPFESAAVSIGSIHAGKAFNVIPDKVEITGTLRTFDKQLRTSLIHRIKEICENIPRAFGGEGIFELIPHYPITINNAEITGLVKEEAEILLGKKNIDPNICSMGGEDVSYYLECVPGSFFFVGAGNAAKGIDKPHHHPEFNIDEDALSIGLQLMLNVVKRYFSS